MRVERQEEGEDAATKDALATAAAGPQWSTMQLIRFVGRTARSSKWSDALDSAAATATLSSASLLRLLSLCDSLMMMLLLRA